MFTVFSDPQQVVPVKIQMPTHKDELGGGALALRRVHTRGLRRWEIRVPDRQAQIDQLLGLIEYVQGDNAFWFDGAGSLEVYDPIIVGFGNAALTDFTLPHRHVFVSSAIIYLNGAATADWTPLGDGITMDAVRFDSAPAANVQVTAKYRRKAKVVVDTEDVSHESVMTDEDEMEKNFFNVRYFLQEVPF